MNEDAAYRSSTQFRLWSFNESQLAAVRESTNQNAVLRVRDARKRAGAGDAECLTVHEEQKLIVYYCIKTMELADFFQFPSNVKATAVQYLKRFYLSNSPMTYHPKTIMYPALFLSTKTENHHIELASFSAKIDKTTPESVIAPEFLVTQGLRFTFDVRHPLRGLEGGFMELIAIAEGTAPAVPTQGDVREHQHTMLNLPGPSGNQTLPPTVENLKLRIRDAHSKAKEILKTTALLSDAYFLYTPSQIWIAALMAADEPLAKFYLSLKIPASSPVAEKMNRVLQACIKTLSAVGILPVNLTAGDRSEIERLQRKLALTQNPEKADLVSLNKAQKRNDADNLTEEERLAKKRKVEDQQARRLADDMFGPAIG